jgi:hypothetical protein
MNQTWNHPVYRAIDTICALKGKATYGEVATVAGIKKQKALDYILRNKAILRMDKKGNILGFITHDANVHRAVAAAFTRGEIFKTEEVNYGCDKAIVVHEFYAEKVKHLLKPYCVGGIGDNYWTNYIIVTEENVKALNDLGFREWNEVVKEKLAKGDDQVWRDWCEV